MINLNQKIYYYCAIAFFLLLNWGAIFFSWHGRNLPPEPDDAGAMLIYIRANMDFNSVFSPQLKIFNRPYYWNPDNGLDRLNYFSWALFWGKFAKLFSLSQEMVFKLSCYFGILILLISILHFFEKESWQLKTILITTLAFFTGDGTYHGFYWPTASLYSVAIFLFILKMIINNHKKILFKFLFILPIFLLLHPFSLILLLSIPVYFLLSKYLLGKEDSSVRIKLLLIFLISICLNTLWFEFLSLKHFALLKNTNLLIGIFSKIFSGKLTFSAHPLNVAINQYLVYMLTRPVFLTLFYFGLINTVKKNLRLVIIYISFIPLLFASLFFNGGERILLPIWIFTFLIFGYGMEFLFELFNKLLKNYPTNGKKRKLFALLLINLIFEFIFIFLILKTDCSKNIILKHFFIWSNIIVLVFVSFSFLFKKKPILFFLLLSLMKFFVFLGLDKSAMVVFQNRNNNIEFNKDYFLAKINSAKEGLIIYNDNLSYTLFSSNGIQDKEVVKKGSLLENDLDKAAYFVVRKSQFKDCQKEICFLEESGKARQMHRIAGDNYFLLFEF